MDPLYSPSWYHVAELRPRVSRQVRFHRHVYRGEPWYVVLAVGDRDGDGLLAKVVASSATSGVYVENEDE